MGQFTLADEKIKFKNVAVERQGNVSRGTWDYILMRSYEHWMSDSAEEKAIVGRVFTILSV